MGPIRGRRRGRGPIGGWIWVSSALYLSSPCPLPLSHVSIMLIYQQRGLLGNISLTCDYANSLLFAHWTIPLRRRSVYIQACCLDYRGGCVCVCERERMSKHVRLCVCVHFHTCVHLCMCTCPRWPRSGSLPDKSTHGAMSIVVEQRSICSEQPRKSARHTFATAASKCSFVWLLRKWKALRLREDQHLLNVLFPTT